jgi:hypothetical protein
MWRSCSLLVLIGIGASVSPLLPHGRMLFIAISTFIVLKFETLRAFNAQDQRATHSETLLWYVAWPGLDAERFFSRRTADHPQLRDWLLAVATCILGLVLWLLVAGSLVEVQPLFAGWVGIAGLLLMIHFGLLHLIALFWRSRGRDVTPLMNAPGLATSLSEFWGRRWNTAFRDFAHQSVFKPAARRWGAATATWAVFAFSGLIHELAISVPAGGGYGWPFAYFVLQGSGVWLERQATRSGIRVRGGIRGWCFMAIFTIPAAALLFHPAFVCRVILPLIPD